MPFREPADEPPEPERSSVQIVPTASAAYALQAWERQKYARLPWWGKILKFRKHRRTLRYYGANL